MSITEWLVYTAQRSLTAFCVSVAVTAGIISTVNCLLGKDKPDHDASLMEAIREIGEKGGEG